MTILETTHLAKSFGRSTAVRSASLEVTTGHVHALLGPSGCGKTTMLRLLAGFERPDAGEVRIAGQIVANEKHWVPPEKRKVGMVFQEYHLFPHLNVRENVAYGLPPEERRNGHVDDVLKMVGLEDFARVAPHTLSGGQQQRVALARALAPRPQLLLMDEPFSNLDARLRVRLREEVRDILRRASMTSLFVTHDQEEALSISDMVSVMVDGRIVQSAPPRTLYFRPATEFVAEFVGEANFLNGEARSRIVETAVGTVIVDQEHFGPVRVLIRPESLQLSHRPQGRAAATATVSGVQFFGHDQLLALSLAGGEIVHARVGPEWQARPGETVYVTVRGVLRAFESVSTVVS